MQETLLVEGLNEHIREEELEELFSEWGKVTAVWITAGEARETGEPFRFGFVQMEDAMEMSFAYQALRRKKWRGMRLKVSYAQPHL